MVFQELTFILTGKITANILFTFSTRCKPYTSYRYLQVVRRQSEATKTFIRTRFMTLVHMTIDS